MSYTFKGKGRGGADVEYSSMLEAMDNLRIFSITAEGEIREECDQEYRVTLTRRQLLALAEELTAIANQLPA